MELNQSIIKNVIYKYPPIFLTLPTFYQLVCNTVWIEACARQFSPIKQRSLFALASFSILLLCNSQIQMLQNNWDLTNPGFPALCKTANIPPLNNSNPKMCATGVIIHMAFIEPDQRIYISDRSIHYYLSVSQSRRGEVGWVKSL